MATHRISRRGLGGWGGDSPPMGLSRFHICTRGVTHGRCSTWNNSGHSRGIQGGEMGNGIQGFQEKAVGTFRVCCRICFGAGIVAATGGAGIHHWLLGWYWPSPTAYDRQSSGGLPRHGDADIPRDVSGDGPDMQGASACIDRTGKAYGDVPPGYVGVVDRIPGQGGAPFPSCVDGLGRENLGGQDVGRNHRGK